MGHNPRNLAHTIHVLYCSDREGLNFERKLKGMAPFTDEEWEAECRRNAGTAVDVELALGGVTSALAGAFTAAGPAAAKE